MSKRVKRAAGVIVVVLAAAQFVRADRSNPPTDERRTIRAHAGTDSRLADVLDRACGDCHSNNTVWPRYARVAPLSWLMAYAVREGRSALNFSEWATYTPEQQSILLGLSCQDASEGKMPGPYSLIRPDTKLSVQDVRTICGAAGHTEARMAGGGQ